MIVRVDDVSPNTDFDDLYQQLQELEEKFDDIILGVNIFGKRAINGAVYPDLPLKYQDRGYFYNVDGFLGMEILDELCSFPKVSLVSHGLIHSMHGNMSKDAIEMSILTSCSILGTKRFIPPFNNTSEDVRIVCEENGIEIIGNDESTTWHSLETEKFNPLYQTWYYHPWRVNANILHRALSGVVSV